MMIIKDLSELKNIIKNNVEIFKLIDYLKSYQSGEEQEIKNIFLKNAKVDLGKPWYAEINTLYSSITLVSEYINAKNNNINDLDKNFNINDWYIEDAYEFDDNHVKLEKKTDLATIVKRMRNSISHGLFQLKVKSEVSEYLIIFNDVNTFKYAKPESKNFKITFKAMNLQRFLGKLENCFDSQYPS